MKRIDNKSRLVKDFYLRNLARLRAALTVRDPETDALLFINIEETIQDLLHEVGIDWQNYDSEEDLES